MMIKVKFRYDSENGIFLMHIRGHASYAPRGEDLVCAAVSSLAITAGSAAQMFWAQGFLKRPPLVRLCDADALVIVTPQEECMDAVAMAFWTVQAGVFALEQRYRQYVELERVLKV